MKRQRGIAWVLLHAVLHADVALGSRPLLLPPYFAWPKETSLNFKLGDEVLTSRYLESNPFTLPLPDFGNVFVEEPGECPTTVLERLELIPEVSIFAQAVKAESSNSRVSALVSDPFAINTVFAPTNDAFFRLATVVGGTTGEGENESLKISRKILLETLPAHIIEDQALTTATLTSGRVLTTSSSTGESLLVLGTESGGGGGGLFAVSTNITTGELTQTDIKACDSIIHIVDSVLVPASASISDYVADYFEGFTVPVEGTPGAGAVFTDITRR